MPKRPCNSFLSVSRLSRWLKRTLPTLIDWGHMSSGNQRWVVHLKRNSLRSLFMMIKAICMKLWNKSKFECRTQELGTEADSRHSGGLLIPRKRSYRIIKANHSYSFRPKVMSSSRSLINWGRPPIKQNAFYMNSSKICLLLRRDS